MFVTPAASHRYATLIACCVLVSVCLIPKQPVSAQTTPVKYWIFFTDKSGAGSAADDRSTSPVTAEALERRRLRGSRSHPQDDLPVSPVYVDRLEELGIQPIVTSRWFNAVSAHLDPDHLERVRRLPFVRNLRPVARREMPPPTPPGHPKRERRGRLPSAADVTIRYGPSQLQLALMNAISPLEQGFNGEGVIVGFLDTKFDFEHPALRHIKNDDRLIATRDFTQPLVDSTGIVNDNYHGLSVTSAALGYAEGTLIGPAHRARVLAATTEYVPRERNQEEDFFVAGMEWLERQGVDVVNVSLGYTTFDSGQTDYTYEDMDGNTAVSTRAADRAVSKGVVVVASAGNEGWCSSPDGPCWYYIGAPADGDSVITVGAVQPDSTRAYFSSYGPTFDGQIKPDVSALGSSSAVYVAERPDTYDYSQGTSFSSPLVTGVVAQMLQANPALTPVEVRDILRGTASRASNPNNAIGWGIVNAAAAVNEAQRLTYPDSPQISESYPNPFIESAHVTVDMPADQPERARLTLYDMLGRRVAQPFSGLLVPGPNAIPIDGTNLPPGIYLYRLVSKSFTESGTIVRAQ